MDIYYSNAYVHNWEAQNIKPFPTLISFYNFPKNFKRQNKFSKLMLDSGAFSAWRQNISINVQDYIRFIKNNNIQYDVIVSLDIFGNDEESYKNYIIMKKAGLNILPVYHADANMKYLYKYVNQTNYIGLGGFAKAYKKNRILSMKRVFKEFPNANEIGFHGFGVNDKDLVLNFPWKSVDASTAHILARLGNVITQWGPLALSVSVSKDRLLWKTDNKIKNVDDFLKSIGADLKLVKLGNVSGTIERCRLNINYFEEQIKPNVPLIYENKVNLFNFHSK